MDPADTKISLIRNIGLRDTEDPPCVCTGRDRRGGVYYETAWQTALSAPAQIGEGREKLMDYRSSGFPVSQ
jgi:hypothetical protein